MNTLVIGGTRFVGRHIVDALLRFGHSVTLFNRGSRADLYPQLEAIHGDRDDSAALAPLGARRWDAVVDTSAYRPEQVDALLGVLRGAPHYLFVSTVSVYADPDAHLAGGAATVTEDAPLHRPALDADAVTGATYGPLKVACEAAAWRHEGRVTVLRPGVVVGPWDYTERFPYWVARAARGAPFVAPAEDAALQFIDARDLAEFAVRRLDPGLDQRAGERGGTFNLVTPPGEHRFAPLLDAALAAAERVDGASAGEAVRIPSRWLEARGVEPWSDLPLWPPEGQRGLFRADPGRAVEAGLTFRALDVTVGDTLAWLLARPEGPAVTTGLDPEREAELIAAWRRGRG